MRRLLLAALLMTACGEPNHLDLFEDLPSPLPSAGDFLITAFEYEFQGAPVLLSEGEYRFTLDNAGEEKHELYLFHITGTESVEDLLELPPNRLSTLTQAVDRVVTPPGHQPSSFTAALVPGRFGYVCLVSAPDGTLHSDLGMRGEFTVT